MKYGFLGAGNMASAIIKGMVKSGVNPREIGVFNRTEAKSIALAKECGIEVCQSRAELLESEVVILSVKPQVLDEIIDSIKTELGNKNPLIISLAVGKTLTYLENKLGVNKHLVRVMPNINAKVLMSTTGFCLNANCSENDGKTIETIFGSIGSTSEISENMFSVFAVIAGSAPAFAYLYIDALTRVAQKAGMPRTQALDIVVNTVLGSAKMVLESNEHPVALIDQVCSPGGTTIAGVCALKENNFETALLKAVEASLERDRQIQEKK